MGRTTVNPNVDAPPAPHTRGTEWASEAAEAEREEIRGEARATAAAMSETLSEREADARREVPRTITDAANPRKDRALPPPDAERRMLSSNMQKALNKQKVAWSNDLPKTRHAAVTRTVSSQKSLEGVNSALHDSVGVRSELRPATQRRVRELDRSIQDYERGNDRQHVVYSVLKSPKDHGNSRNALRRSLERMSNDPDDDNPRSLTFDGYIPATHSLGNVPEGDDIVMEVRTRSGAYLGSSDTTPNSDHIVGRGRVLRPVGVHEVTYVRPDGSNGTRTVVQMDDVTPDE